MASIIQMQSDLVNLKKRVDLLEQVVWNPKPTEAPLPPPPPPEPEPVAQPVVAKLRKKRAKDND